MSMPTKSETRVRLAEAVNVAEANLKSRKDRAEKAELALKTISETWRTQSEEYALALKSLEGPISGPGERLAIVNQTNEILAALEEIEPAMQKAKSEFGTARSLEKEAVNEAEVAHRRMLDAFPKLERTEIEPTEMEPEQMEKVA